MSGNQEQLSILVGGRNHGNVSGLGYKEYAHPVRTIADQLVPTEVFIKPTLSELEELEEEYLLFLEKDKKTDQKPSTYDMIKEFCDVVVMEELVKKNLAPKFSVEETIFSVNGQFNGDFSSLKDKVGNIQSGNLERNFKSFFEELLSFLKHLDINLQGEFYAKVTNTKLAFNREARFFQLEPNMTDADIISKSDHVFKCLRTLRDVLIDSNGINATLQPWITDFFIDEIMDWRHAEEAFARLKKKTELFKDELKSQVAWALTAELSTDASLLMTKMTMAGIPTVKDPKRKLKPLQISSYNASLSKETIFWV